MAKGVVNPKKSRSTTDTRQARRTLADALHALTENPQAEVRIAPMLLQDGSHAASVAVIVSRPSVLMPSATHFTALDTSGVPVRREIAALDCAVTDFNGNVKLADGTRVRAVELELAPITRELTPEQGNVLRCVLKVLGAENRCYRPLAPDLLPGLMVLDYAKVAELGEDELPSLKAIERDVLREMRGITRHKLAEVLALAGLRRPRSGPRARPKSEN